MKIIATKRSIRESKMIDYADFNKNVTIIAENIIKPQIEFANKSKDIELTSTQNAYSNCNIHI